MVIDWKLTDWEFSLLCDDVLRCEAVYGDDFKELSKKGFLVFHERGSWSGYETSQEFDKWLMSKVNEEVDAAQNPPVGIARELAAKDAEIRELKKRIEKLEGYLEAGRKVSANVRESPGDVLCQESGGKE